MNNSDPDSPSSSRPTLKLKVAARKSPEPKKTTVLVPPTAKKNEPKPGAHWSDEYKRRMQADMDELIQGK